MNGIQEKNEPVIGLTIQLQKYGLDKLGKGGNPISDIMLGHYDSLIIQPITQWLQYSPGNGKEGKAINDISVLVTHYPIKLLFPDCALSDKVLVDFNYQAWKDPDSLLAEHPCMALALVNLTDSYKNDVGDDLLVNFAGLIRDFCNNKQMDLSEINCCILPSIGYSDFCLLMADDSWAHAMKLIEGLHTIQTQMGTPVLSTDYLMPVYHRSSKNTNRKLSKKRFEGVQLSIRVNLMPGCNAQMLANCVPEKVSVYRTSGGTDCLLCAESEEAEKDLFDFILQRRTESGNFVLDMASTLKLRMEKVDLPDQSTFNNRYFPDLEKAVNNFEKAINLYEEQLKVHNRHTRQANSLRELAASIRNICAQQHTGALRKIMLDFLANFMHCLNVCSANMKNEEFVRFGPPILEVERVVGKLCAKVNSFLADLSRSDCFYMDREKYNHTSISSATSLLIAYNQWLNDFTDCVQKVTQAKNKSDYAFLVTSGGCDQTRIFNAFHFLEPQIKNRQLYERIPLLIQMSEMSLYDFSGTIMRAVHECMHYCGNRCRKNRLMYIVHFVVQHLSEFLSNTLFNESNSYDYAINVLKLHTASLTDEEINKAKINIRIAYHQERKNFEEKIADSLMEYFPSNLDRGWEKTDYLIRNVREWIFDKLFDAFSGHEYSHKQLRVNSFAAMLYKGSQHAMRAFFVKCDSIFVSYHVTTMTFAFETKKLEAYFSQQEDDRNCDRDPILYRTIQMVLSRLLITDPSSFIPSDEDDHANREWDKKFPYFNLISSNIRAIMESTTDVFSESFADVVACEILNANFEDYLLMHVYEDWDLDDALDVSSFSNIYRIPAVIKVCFPNEIESDGLCLKSDARLKIRNALNRLDGHGMPAERLDSDTLCDRIDFLLNCWREHQSTGQFLIDYLIECRNVYQDNSVKEGLAAYPEAFRKIRLLSIEPGTDDSHKKILQMIHSLVGSKVGPYDSEIENN